MLSDEELSHLQWVINRIVHKFGDSESDEHIVRAKEILNKLLNKNIDISDDDLDQIISKYYVDFFYDKSEFLGFTNEERIKFRQQIRGICEDILSNHFLKETRGQQCY